MSAIVVLALAPLTAHAQATSAAEGPSAEASAEAAHATPAAEGADSTPAPADGSDAAPAAEGAAPTPAAEVEATTPAAEVEAQTPADPCAAAARVIARRHEGDDEFAEYSDIQSCYGLAVATYDRLRGRIVATREDAAQQVDTLTPPASEAPGGVGTPAQLAAAPSAAPISLAGGAVSLAGSRSGPRLVAAMSINPAAVALSGSDDEQSVAIATRSLDIGVVLPFDLAEQAMDDNPLDFFGVRLRANILAPISGATAAEMDAHLGNLQEYRTEVQQEILDTLQTLESSEDVSECVEAIAAQSDMEAKCGGRAVTFDASLEEATASMVEEIRREADRYYFGLDLRYDYGDVALTGDPIAAQVSSLLAGAAVGGRIDATSWLTIQLRGRVGIHYAHAPMPTGTPDLDPISVDYGLAVEGEVLVGTDMIRLSVGFEGRELSEGVATAMNAGTGSQVAVTPTEYHDLRLALLFPLGQNGVGVDLSVPLVGDRGVQVAVSGDFALALSGRR